MPKLFIVFCLVLVSGCQVLNNTTSPFGPSEPSQLSDLKGSALAVAFSPDGSTLAVSEGTPPGAVSLWSVSSGRRLTTIRDTAVVDSLAFSPDGTCLATLGTQVFWRGNCPPLTGPFDVVWEVGTGKAKHSLAHEPGDNLTSIAYSHDGQTLATGKSSGAVVLWNAATQKERLVLKGHTGTVHAIAFSADGKLLATAGEDKTVRLWDTATGEVAGELHGHKQPVRAVAFHPKENLLVSGGGSFDINKPSTEVLVWKVGESTPLLHSVLPQQAVVALTFDPEGLWFAAGSRDGKVTIQEFIVGSEPDSPVSICEGKRERLPQLMNFTSLAVSPDGKLLATAEGTGDLIISNGRVRLWDTATGKEVHPAP